MSNAASNNRPDKKPNRKDTNVLKFKGLDEGNQKPDTPKSTRPLVSKQETLAKVTLKKPSEVNHICRAKIVDRNRVNSALGLSIHMCLKSPTNPCMDILSL